jgi:hypothetical protein
MALPFKLSVRVNSSPKLKKEKAEKDWIQILATNLNTTCTHSPFFRCSLEDIAL